jgi:acetyl esterase/lipase
VSIKVFHSLARLHDRPVPEDRSVLTRPSPPPDEVLRYGPEPEHVADVRFARSGSSAKPLVFHIHGGFWRPETDRSHTAPTGAALAESGWTFVAIEYRRVPGHPKSTTEDVLRALSSLPAMVGSHDGRVLVTGHSAGGHLALWTAALRPIPALAGALGLAPVADLHLAHDLHLGNDATLAFLGDHPNGFPDLDPRRMATPEIPVAIVHGNDDQIVPISLAQSYVDTHHGARIVAVAGAGHFAVIDPTSNAWPAVLSELERLSR